MEAAKALYLLVVMTIVCYGIIKKYYPQGVLLFGGALFITGALLFSNQPAATMMKLLDGVQGTGVYVFDIHYHLEQLFSYRLSDLGLKIMAIGGFSFFLTHTGASNELLFYSTKPVSRIHNPYLLLGLFYLIGAMLSLFITSAASLGLLCMFTFFPILTSAGVSPLSAVGMIVTTGCLDMGVLSTNTLRASEAVLMDAATYFTSHQLPVILPTALIVSGTHMIWQKTMDQRMGYDYKLNRMELKSISRQAPGVYALLPVVPFALILLFGGSDSRIQIDVTTAMLVSLTVGLVFEFFRYRSVSKLMQALEVYFKGMIRVFPVVSLIVCAGFFADGLIAMGAIELFVKASETIGVGGGVMTVVLALVGALMAALIGSGNAVFLPVAKLVPGIAGKLGLPGINMILPLNLTVGLGRSVSPISAVVIACSDIAQVTPYDVIKRSSVPMAAGFVSVIFFTFTSL